MIGVYSLMNKGLGERLAFSQTIGKFSRNLDLLIVAKEIFYEIKG